MPELALITGASRGIGRAIASTLAGEGIPVVLVSRSDRELSDLRNEIVESGGQAFAYPCDITIESDVTNMRRDVEMEMGPLTLLINNAGIAPSVKLAETTSALWSATFAINVDAPFFLLREFLPAMKLAKSGHVISIASTAALQGFKYNAAYTASKHALLGLMRAVKEEYAPDILFSTICPGFVRTGVFDKGVANVMAKTGKSKKETELAFASMNHEGKIIEPQEIASTVLQLALNRNIESGVTYHADGTIIGT